jgi:ligand-binding sensor domain-containing protein
MTNLRRQRCISLLSAGIPPAVSAFVWCWLLLSTVPLLIAQPGISFSRYSIEQGLSQSNPFCIIQDKRGFIWVGTQDGLNKFDGYTFTIYRPTPKNALSDAHIQALYEDKQGILWIGTRNGGINSFDYTTEKFTAYTASANASGKTNAVTSNDIRAITEDAQGRLWIGSANGVFMLNRQTMRFTHFPQFTDSESKEKPSGTSVYALDWYERRFGAISSRNQANTCSAQRVFFNGYSFIMR